ncbi:MAG: hypothetical protein J0H61_05820 [Alphaproteobacteria bacterium]|jgi:hypothetical protein|nr:hypothetical protein [Alphaproteobacteria bacterium]
MAFAGVYDDVLDQAQWRAPAAREIDPDILAELEFSEIGRDARFLPGWYILPSALGGLLVLVALLT